ELCVDSSNTESDGDLAKSVATHSSTSPCTCARTAFHSSHLFQATENAFSAISASPGINKGRRSF
ncbi:hypothetical protein ALC53_08708, partial [Atta colombica]